MWVMYIYTCLKKRANFGKLYSFDKYGPILIIFDQRHCSTLLKMITHI